MPDISKTDLLEFVLLSGRPRQTTVKEIKERSDYYRALDY